MVYCSFICLTLCFCLFCEVVSCVILLIHLFNSSVICLFCEVVGCVLLIHLFNSSISCLFCEVVWGTAYPSV